MTRQTLSVRETAATLGLSPAATYKAVERGDIRSIRIGGRILVPRAAIERLLDTDIPVARTA
jgi:excisionase family DNA binding protein